jgi:hypothetical protein
MSSKYHALAVPLLAILFLPTFLFAKCDKPTALKATINGQQVTLTWSGAATQFMIQIESTKNETKVIPEQSATSPFTTTLVGGKYSFKVRSMCGKDKGDWTDDVFFTIGASPTVTGSTAGKDNNSSKSGEDKKKDSVKCSEPSMLAAAVTGVQATLTWKGTATSFLIHVESNPSKAKPIPEVQGTSPFLITLDSGKYKFKVKAICDSAHTSGWSDSQSFTLGKDNSNAGGKQEHEKPDTNKEAEHKKDSIKCNEPGMLAAAVTGLQASLTWKGNAPLFLVHVESKSGGAKPIPEVQAASPFLITLDSGRYKFKVKALCDSIHKSDWSDAISFTVGIDSSSIKEKHGEHEKPDTTKDDDENEHKDTVTCHEPSMLAASVDRLQVSLSWKSTAPLFILRIESKEPLSKPFSDIQATSPFIITLDTGRYLFKVKALCDSMHRSEWSDAKNFIIKSDTLTIPVPVPIHNPPILSSEDHNKKNDTCKTPKMLRSVVSGNNIRLSWSAGNHTLFNIDIRNTKTDSVFIKATGVSNPFEATLPDGRYKYRISSLCDTSLSSAWSNWARFNVGKDTTRHDRDQPIDSSCKSPLLVTVLKAQDTSLALTWKKVNDSATYTIEVENNHVIPPVKVHIENYPDTFILINGLVPNTAYTIEVETNCAKGISPKPSGITSMTGSSPKPGDSNGMSKFDCGIPSGMTASVLTNASVLLSWVAVPNARLYLLEIESEDGTTSFFKRFSTSGNSLEISNLMAGGHYAFKVRAVCSFSKSDYSRALSFTMPANTFSNSILENRSSDHSIGLSVFPNPAHHQVNLILADARDKIGDIQIVDMNGRVISQLKDTPLDHMIPLNISRVNTGVYTVRVTTGPTQWVKKLIIH